MEAISKEFSEAFLAAQRDMKNPAKNHTAIVKMKSGGQFSYKYASLDETMECVKEALHAQGIAIAQPPVSEAGCIGIRTELIYGEEIWDRGTLLMPASDDPQKVGSALTYLRRYGLSSAVGMVAEDDDDGQGAQGKGSTDKPQATPGPTREEMGNDLDKALNKPQDPATGEDMPPVITEKQGKRMYMIAKGKGWDKDGMKAVVNQYGFASSKDVTKDKYEVICGVFECGPA